MKFCAPIMAVLCALLSPIAAAEALTLERIFSDPSLSGKAPLSLRFSPDGERVTFRQANAEDYERFDLWEYHIPSARTRMLVDSKRLHGGDEVLSDEEKARRERQRVYGKGVMEYFWSQDGRALLFPLAGDIYHYNLKQQRAKRLTTTEAFETDIKFSPLGNYVSFIRDQDLYVLDIASGREQRLTKDGGGVIKNGMAEFVAQEEMARRTGYWWAPDESRIAFTRVDESPVDLVIRNEIYAEEVKLIEQRYPATGTNNVKIELGVATLGTGKTRWLALDQGERDDGDFYLPRVKWLPDSRTLSYQWQSRNQQALKLVFANTDNGKSRILLTERSKTWLNLHKDLYFLKDSSQFIWASERDGFKHLYLYENSGKLLRQLTQGEWVVNSLAGVDEARGEVFFSGRKDSPIEQHLYRVSLAGAEPVRVTQRPGFHRVVMREDGGHYIDNYSTVNTPPQVSLHKISGERVTWLEENAVTGEHPLAPYQDQWSKPEFGTLKATDGQALHYRLFKPVDFDPHKRYPVIVKAYGGPSAQLVTDSWSGSNFVLQHWVSRGYLVFQLDNRGSENRGVAFESPIYKRLGEVEVADQVSGVKFLRGLGYVDPERVGIFGHSYGGYMALMAMFTASDYFQAGVSGAPVTDWGLYDTHYTERYLSHPASNKEGYELSSVFPHVDGLKGPVLIYHGMADDNVLFANSTKLYQLLQHKALPFEMMNYPGSKHSMRGKRVGLHLNRTIADFFERSLALK